MPKLTTMYCLFIFVLTGCATTYDTWQEAFKAYDEAGCQASLWSNDQAAQCLSYAAATYCDQRFGLQQSWKSPETRSQNWVACAQVRYDHLVSQHMAQKQAVGNTMMQSGQSIINSSTTGSGDSATSERFGHLTGESTSGMNKICYYNVTGSTHSLNVGAADLCPLTATF